MNLENSVFLFAFLHFFREVEFNYSVNLRFFSGVFTVFLENKFGSRSVLICSTVTITIGLLLVPLSTGAIHVGILFGILVGK